MEALLNVYDYFLGGLLGILYYLLYFLFPYSAGYCLTDFRKKYFWHLLLLGVSPLLLFSEHEFYIRNINPLAECLDIVIFCFIYGMLINIGTLLYQKFFWQKCSG